jgi:hypothetical protein
MLAYKESGGVAKQPSDSTILRGVVTKPKHFVQTAYAIWGIFNVQNGHENSMSHMSTEVS